MIRIKTNMGLIYAKWDSQEISTENITKYSQNSLSRYLYSKKGNPSNIYQGILFLIPV